MNQDQKKQTKMNWLAPQAKCLRLLTLAKEGVTMVKEEVTMVKEWVTMVKEHRLPVAEDRQEMNKKQTPVQKSEEQPGEKRKLVLKQREEVEVVTTKPQ